MLVRRDPMLLLSVPVIRAGAFLIAICVGAWNLYNLYVHAASANHRGLAKIVEAGTVLDWKFFAQYDAQYEAERFLPTCRSDLLRASVSIRLAARDSAMRERDFAIIDAAHQDAERVLLALLRCNPLDGNAWLRLAMIDTWRNGPSPQVLDRLRASYWAAPGEGWIMKPRLAFASLLIDSGAQGLDQHFRREVINFALSGRTADFVESYLQSRAQARELYDATLAMLPEQQHRSLRQAIESKVKPREAPAVESATALPRGCQVELEALQKSSNPPHILPHDRPQTLLGETCHREAGR